MFDSNTNHLPRSQSAGVCVYALHIGLPVMNGRLISLLVLFVFSTTSRSEDSVVRTSPYWHSVGSTESNIVRAYPQDVVDPDATDRNAIDSNRFRLFDRKSLAERGLVYGGSLTWDGSKNLRGGLDTNGFASRYLLDMNLQADLDYLLGWRGMSLFVDFQHHDGNLGDALVGDFQVFSNIDAPRRTQIPQAWLETLLLDNQLRIKAGKIDANSEFAYTLSGVEGNARARSAFKFTSDCRSLFRHHEYQSLRQPLTQTRTSRS